MHDIGYVRGILDGDGQSGYVVDDSGQRVCLPRGSSDAALEPYHVDRSNLTTGAETACLKGHAGGVNALCVLPDGRLASGGGDRTIRLWDLTTRAEAARLEIDTPVGCLITLSVARFVAGDVRGGVHWLEVVD